MQWAIASRPPHPVALSLHKMLPELGDEVGNDADERDCKGACGNETKQDRRFDDRKPKLLAHLFAPVCM